MNGNKWGIVFLLMCYAALGHFNRVGISVAGDEVFIPKIGIDTERMGWVYTAFLIVYTLAMLPGGWLIDRIGSARSLTIYGITMGLFVMLTGVLGWFGLSPFGLWVALLVIRSFAGMCNAPLHPSAAHVVARVMTDQQRATANGMVTAGALVGIALCYPLFGLFMDKLSWPGAFVFSGSLLMGFGIVWAVLAGPSLPHVSHLQKEAKPAATVTVQQLLTNMNLWLVTLSYAAYGYFQYLFFYWMGYYFKEVLEVPPVSARMASFWIMLAMGGGMLIGGISTDVVCKRLGTAAGRRAIVLFGMGLGGIFGIVGVNMTTLVSIASFLALSMACVGMVEGVFWTTATDLGGQRRSGFAGAFMNTGGNVGGLIAPVLTPVMAKQIGWTNSIIVACVISALGGLVWFLIQLPQAPTTTISPEEEEL